MVLNKPYRRIIRPFKFTNGRYVNATIGDWYIIDSNYSSERVDLVRAYNILEKDLIRTLDYIEPSDENLATYSHRLYELLLRASTEFEMNCKGILKANNYSGSNRLNMQDYYKINSSSHLSAYEIRVAIWSGHRKIIRPFGDWNNGHSLKWYQNYNDVKHNRSDNFKLANLENVLLAIAGVFTILFSQFFVLSFRPNVLVAEYSEDDGWIAHENSIFEIKPPQNWHLSECYDFEWNTLKSQPGNFSNYSF